MFLICGLGNPGVNYNNTRHNVGFHLADNIISHFNLDKIKEDKIKQLYSGKIDSHKVILLKPLTFMNLSGKAVFEIVSFYKIKKNNIFVVHDDLDLKLAKVKIKKISNFYETPSYPNRSFPNYLNVGILCSFSENPDILFKIVKLLLINSLSNYRKCISFFCKNQLENHIVPFSKR